MAEILIQRKRRRSVWPWLLSLLVLALLPLPFVVGDRSDVTRLAAARRDTTARPDTSALHDSAARRMDSAAVADAASGATASTSAPASGPAGSGQPATAERTTATAAGTIVPAEGSASRPSTPTSAPVGAPAEGESFRTFIAATPTPTTERAHREYTADALRRLADDLRTLGATEASVSTIRVHADSLRLPNARSGARPDWTRAAFLATVRELDLLRGQQRARIDIGRLRSTAWAINPRRSLVSQRGTVDRFFATARDALDSLSRRG